MISMRGYELKKIIRSKLLTHTATHSTRPRKERSDMIVRVLRSTEEVFSPQ
jgi:hypothetical protein